MPPGHVLQVSPLRGFPVYDGDEQAMGWPPQVLALEQARGHRRHPPENLPVGVDDMPPALCALGARNERTHGYGIPSP